MKKKTFSIKKTVEQCSACNFHCTYIPSYKIIELSDGRTTQPRRMCICYHETFFLKPKFIAFVDFEPLKTSSIPIPEWCPLED